MLARRFARPLALYVTWLIVRLPMSANVVTAATLVAGLIAAALLGVGSTTSFVAGAIVLQLWYVLDHVDGQVARFRRSESVTGVYFDFMMHHIVHPAVAFAIGFGIAAQTGELSWTLAGAAFAIGLATLSLSNDCRYKAFFAESKRGEWRRAEGAGPNAGKACEQSRRRFAVRLMQKSCEIPNIVIAVTLVAMSMLWNAAAGGLVIQIYLAIMAMIAPLLGLARLARQVWQKSIDVEFREFFDTSGTTEPRSQQFDEPPTKQAA